MSRKCGFLKTPLCAEIERRHFHRFRFRFGFWNFGPVRFGPWFGQFGSVSVFWLTVQPLYSTDFSGNPWPILIDYFSSVWFSVYHATPIRSIQYRFLRNTLPIMMEDFDFSVNRTVPISLEPLDRFWWKISIETLWKSWWFCAFFQGITRAHHHKKRRTSLSRCIF